MNYNEIKEQSDKNITATYSRYPVAFVGGKGARLIDSEGKSYLDFGAGIAVNTFGVGDKSWVKAVAAQAAKLQHISNLYYTEPQTALSATLIAKTGAQNVFFANSGTEANECAIKAARKYSRDLYGEGRATIVTLNGSFHGRTMGALSATGQSSFHVHFGPFCPGFKYIDITVAALRKALTDDVCALMIETIQGEGGVVKVPAKFLAEAQKMCAERDILLIIDEVQTGNGRTGALYSYQKLGLKPDIVTTAKGLGGGLPIGACMFFEKTANVLVPGTHGSTFGGNPIAAAGALSILSRLDQKLLHSVAKKGRYLKKHLQALPGVQFVSGEGLMLGFKCQKSAKEVVMECLKRGLIVLTAKDKVRLLPPLNITVKELDEGIAILAEVLQ